MEEKKSKVWGTVTEIASAPAALVGGLVGGTVNVVTGHGSFMEGADNTSANIMNSARDFGEKHGDVITDGLLRGAASEMGKRAVNGRQIK